MIDISMLYSACNFIYAFQIVQLDVTFVFPGYRGKCPASLEGNPSVRIHNNFCYQFVNERKTWYASKEDCRLKGGMLIVIDEQSIQQFVVQSINSLRWTDDGVWIAATDNQRHSHWKWLTGALLILLLLMLSLLTLMADWHSVVVVELPRIPEDDL